MRFGCVWLVLASTLAWAQTPPPVKPADAKGGDPFALPSKSKPAAAETTSAAATPADDGKAPVGMRSATGAGPLGLDRVWSADPGAPGTFRLHVGLGYSKASDWPLDGSDNTFVSNDYALAYTPMEYLELFLGMRNTSNSNDGSKPAHIATQGDLTFGLKGGYFVTDVVGIGAAASLRLLGGIDGGGPVGAGTSAEFRGLFTFDMNRGKVAPVRVLFDVSYYIENGEALYDDEPQEPDIVQDWGLQAGRYDRMMLGLALEGLVEPWVAPYLEYRIGTPFLVQTDRRGEGSREFSFGSVPHTITPGIRAFPHETVAIDLGVRVGLSDEPFTGVTATPPWELFFGVGYTLDPRPQIIEREVAPAAPPPPPPPEYGAVVGRVLDAKTNQPIAGATVLYPGKNYSPQTTGKDGRYGGYLLEPGPVEVRASARGYAPAAGKGTVVAGTGANLKVSLKPLSKGKLEVRVFDDLGKKMGAKVHLGDAIEGDATVDEPFLVEAKPGKYELRVGTAGFVENKREVEIKSGETTTLRVALQSDGGKRAPAKRPRSGGAESARQGVATFTGKGIKMRRPITFTGKTAKLTPAGRKALNDLAALLQSVPQVTRLRIMAHTDNRGKASKLESLSNDRARAVRSYLIKRGVSAKRLSARGLGSKKPVAPNLTARGRAKNNRIEFLVLELE